jgi:uncharacterized membrane protein YeiH
VVNLLSLLPVLASYPVTIGGELGGWDWWGDFTTIDLIAATTNALNGALLARSPDHYRKYTIVGVVLMGVLGGIGGGVTRDMMVDEVPSALINPAYLLLTVSAGIIGYLVAFGPGQKFRMGWFQLMTAFSLPWYAIVGAQKGINVGLPIFGALVLAVVGPTAGRFFIDLVSGVTPQQFIRGEWFVGTALLTGSVWIFVYWVGENTWISAGVAFAVGFTFRVLAMRREWEEPMPDQQDEREVAPQAA